MFLHDAFLAHPRLVEIDAADKSFADARGEGEKLEHFISDETLIRCSLGHRQPIAVRSGLAGGGRWIRTIGSA